jgi:hypothetical protein
MSVLRAVGRTLIDTLDALRVADIGWINPRPLLELDNIIVTTDGEPVLLEFWLPSADELRASDVQPAGMNCGRQVASPSDEVGWDRCATQGMIDLMRAVFSGPSTERPAAPHARALPVGLVPWIEPYLADESASGDASFKRLIDALEQAALGLDWRASHKRILDHMSWLFGRGYQAAPAAEDFSPPPETLPYPGFASEDLHRPSSRELLAKLVAKTSAQSRSGDAEEKTMPGLQRGLDLRSDQPKAARDRVPVDAPALPLDPSADAAANNWQDDDALDDAPRPETAEPRAAGRFASGVSNCSGADPRSSSRSSDLRAAPTSSEQAHDAASGSVWSLRSSALESGRAPSSSEGAHTSELKSLPLLSQPRDSSTEDRGAVQAASSAVPAPPSGAAGGEQPAVRGTTCSAAESVAHAWDRVLARVAGQRQVHEEELTTSTDNQSGPPNAPRSAWDRAIDRLRGTADRSRPVETSSKPAPSSDSRRPAQLQFDEGLALVREGKPDKALVAWQKAAELEPDNRLYQSNLRILRRRLGLS